MVAFRRSHLDAYRRERGSYLIEMRLRDIRQLFNTLDPSPFNEKDLDAAAEEYLVSAARELGRHPSRLVFHVPASSSSDARVEVASAVRHYFTHRAWHTGEQLRLLLMRGLISLAIGLLFLFTCLSMRQVLDVFGAVPGKEILSEGLLILGWVAMWRPVEIFLYDWWPEFGKRRLFHRIAGMSIEVRPTEVEESSQLPQARSKPRGVVMSPPKAATAVGEWRARSCRSRRRDLHADASTGHCLPSSEETASASFAASS
jgi:hypothetical protein